MIDVSELMFDPDFVQDVLLKTVTFTTVDFEPVQNVTVNEIAACIQVADMEMLNADAIDWSRKYIMAHSHMPMFLGQYIEYKGADYKVIWANDYYDYGYSEVVAEETKLPLLVPIPQLCPFVFDGDDRVVDGDNIVVDCEIYYILDGVDRVFDGLNQLVL